MKSYGKVDEFWDDAKFRALIGDALRMAMERGVPLAVYQDDDGNIVISRARDDWSFMYACVAVVHRNESTGECKTALVGVMPYELYTIEQMIPIARDALARGIFEYDASGPSQTVQKRLRGAAECAERMARMRGEPFIAGLTDRGITVAPISERRRFVETGGVRVHGARRMEPAGCDHVLVCHAGHAAQGILLRDYVRL